MSQNRVQRPTPASSHPFSAELATLRVPAWVVDTAGGIIVAANNAGRQRFGIAPHQPLSVLDGAMPGLARMRALSGVNGHNGEQSTRAVRHRERLVFWTANGVETLTCDVQLAVGKNAAALMLVSVAEPEAIIEESVSDEALPVARGDAETLKVIARAIRNGHVPVPREELRSTEVAADNTPLIPVRVAGEVVTADLSKLAHELKTPLSAIVSASEVIRDERLGALGNDRYRGYVGDIHDSAQHALAVINQMLANAAAGGEPSHVPSMPLTPIDLNAIASRSVSALRVMAEERGLALYDDLEPHLPPVIGDETALRQIILNLMTNAMKFTAWGGEIHVVTRYARDGSAWIAVRDTGQGMSMDEIDAAFDDSAQAEPQWRSGGGLGLGLPLVRQLAEANGALLEIDSVPGRGTAVVLTFPRDRLAAT